MTKWTLHIFSKSLIAAAGRCLAVTGICIFSAVGHAKDAVKDASGRQSNEALKDLQFVTGDEEGNEVRALKTEMLVSSSEKKAVAQIKMLLKKYRNTPIEPDLWFRLAEMHMRRAKSDMFFEVHRKSETIVSLAPNVVKSASSKKLWISMRRSRRGFLVTRSWILFYLTTLSLASNWVRTKGLRPAISSLSPDTRIRLWFQTAIWQLVKWPLIANHSNWL